jgi:tetratricopeptide (TPR) repeat protein
MSVRERATESERAIAAGDRWLARRRFRNAELRYREALAYVPDSAPAARGVAIALHQNRRQELGYSWLVHSLERDPASTESYLALGGMLASRGHDEGARAAWEHVLTLDPDNRQARIRLDRLGDREEPEPDEE